MRCLPMVKDVMVASMSNVSTWICDDQKRCERRIATYVAYHTSINGVDDLSDIMRDQIGAFQMYRTKRTAVIKSVLAPYFGEEL